MHGSRSPQTRKSAAGSQKGAAAWVKWQPVRSVRGPLGAEDRKKSRGCQRVPLAHWPPSPCVSSSVENWVFCSDESGHWLQMSERAPSLVDRRSVRSEVGGSWEFGQPFLLGPGEEGDEQQAIYNRVDGSQTASFWGETARPAILIHQSINISVLCPLKLHTTNTYVTDYCCHLHF